MEIMYIGAFLLCLALFIDNERLSMRVNDLVEEKEKLEQENQELKKQFEEKESQQKKFLEYLKNKERQFDIMGDPINSGACLGISREYKKIIGVKDGKNCI